MLSKLRDLMNILEKSAPVVAANATYLAMKKELDAVEDQLATVLKDTLGDDDQGPTDPPGAP